MQRLGVGWGVRVRLRMWSRLLVLLVHRRGGHPSACACGRSSPVRQWIGRRGLSRAMRTLLPVHSGPLPHMLRWWRLIWVGLHWRTLLLVGGVGLRWLLGGSVPEGRRDEREGDCKLEIPATCGIFFDIHLHMQMLWITNERLRR